MSVDEAIEICESFCEAYERYSECTRYRLIEEDYKATRKLIKEYFKLRKEVTRLAIESIEREKLCARLEAEVMALRDYKLREAIE